MHFDGALSGNGVGVVGSAQGRRRLCAARPDLSARAPAVHVRGCMRTSGVDATARAQRDSGRCLSGSLYRYGLD